jgi:hypothetical protein
VKIEGKLGRKFGFDWGMSQSLPSHTGGTAATIIVGSTAAAGSSTLDLRASTNGTVLIGDIFTHRRQHPDLRRRSSAANVTSAASNIDIRPALVAQASLPVPP